MFVFDQLEASFAAFQPDDVTTWLIPLIFIVVIGAVIFSAVKNIREWLSNNKKPKETEKAKVTSKRESVRRRSGPRTGSRVGIGRSRHQTSYYVAFELENGERREFKVRGNEYGSLSEGDVGYLTFQGTRYHQFERAGQV